MRSSLLDYAFSVLAFYKTAVGLRVNSKLKKNSVSYPEETFIAKVLS